ncbi:MAG: M20/M25/M40 family metallo-hydrolase [candidate division Zixibacteria bacterium]|nr:M20/M25/M40 family metallo-hydrolase [candidate division Zixibacteria bacterium]
MYTSSIKIMASICTFFIFFSFTQAEDLIVIDIESPGLNELDSVEKVDIYAVMKSGLLVGTTPAGTKNMSDEGYSIINIDERDEDSEYYLFQIDHQDIERLLTDIDILYYKDGDAIAKLKPGLDYHSSNLMNGLTHISFTPKPKPRQQPAIPSYSLLTDVEIGDIVSQVSQTEYTAYLQRLQDFVTRYSYSDSCRAAELWAINTFSDLGLETELFSYDYSGNTWYNPIGRKVGLAYPDSIYIIIAHIDATSENPDFSAPGAEDNGSGSAGVLEAARILSQYDFNCTIEFVLVSGEEQGLYGSEAYAEYCFLNNKNIGGVFNFDMIAYEGGYGWDINIYSDQNFPEEVALADLLAQLTDQYSTAYSIRVNTAGPTYGSDHYYFSYYGFPAPFAIDAQMWDAPDWYPWYHTTGDVITNIDLDYATEVVKGAAATLATVAGLWSPPLLQFNYPDGLPELIDPSGGTSFRVEVSAESSDPQTGTGVLYYSTGDTYFSLPMEVVSPNVYDAVFPALECGKDIAFYISVETTDSALVTDPRDAPGISFSAFSASEFTSLYEDDFETDQGWSVSGDATDGHWDRGVPSGLGERGDPPADHDGSGQCYLTDNVYGNSDVDGGTTYLISPTFDLSEGNALFNYALWYTNNSGDDPNNDSFVVWVSNNNGSSWTPVETFGPTTSPGWTEHSFLVDDFIAPTSLVKVRFEASDLNSGSVVEAGIDALSITNIVCDSVATGTIAGMATDNDTAPIQDVLVELIDGVDIIGSDNTDSGGNYSFGGVTPGIYDLDFSQVGYYDVIESDVEVSSGESTIVDMTLHRLGTYGGVVDDYYGTPVEDVHVTAISQVATTRINDDSGPILLDVDPVDNIFTNAAGEFTLTLMPGDYVATFEKDAWTTFTSAQFTIFDDTDMENQDVVFRSPGSLSGVIDDGSVPVEGVHVAVEDDLALIGEDYSDIAGAYSIGEIYDGDYTVTFSHVDYQTVVLTAFHINDGPSGTIQDQTLSELAGYPYLTGDVNMYNGNWPPTVIGGDVTYLVNFFRGVEASVPCLITGFWASADANGDCNVIGSDVTKLVSYFRGMTTLSYCDDYEPLWPTPDDLPVEAPDGWPNCDVAPLTARVIPSVTD